MAGLAREMEKTKSNSEIPAEICPKTNKGAAFFITPPRCNIGRILFLRLGIIKNKKAKGIKINLE